MPTNSPFSSHSSKPSPPKSLHRFLSHSLQYPIYTPQGTFFLCQIRSSPDLTLTSLCPCCFVCCCDPSHQRQRTCTSTFVFFRLDFGRSFIQNPAGSPEAPKSIPELPFDTSTSTSLRSLALYTSVPHGLPIAFPSFSFCILASVH